MPDAHEFHESPGAPCAADAVSDHPPDNCPGNSPGNAADAPSGDDPCGDAEGIEDFLEPTTGERAKWAENQGYDPKFEADQRRARGLDGAARGGSIDGAWIGDPWPADKDMVRGPAPDLRGGGCHMTFEPGIDDDVPPLPPPAAENRLKPRWEAFCRLYACGLSAADAARQAGYAWDSAAQSGWRLLQDKRVKNRVRSLQDYHAQAVPVGVRELCVRAEAIYREAMNRGHYGAAIRAVEFLKRGLPGGKSPQKQNEGPSGRKMMRHPRRLVRTQQNRD